MRGGAVIGKRCVIAERTRVARHVPANCCAVGDSSRVVRTNVYWTHQDDP
ncbi:hypothetical protein [Rhizobium sp. LjRoot98]